MSPARKAKSSCTKSTKKGTKNTKESRAKQNPEPMLKLAERKRGILHAIFVPGFFFAFFVPSFVLFVSSF